MGIHFSASATRRGLKTSLSIYLPRQLRQRVAKIVDLVEPRPEKIVLSTVSPLIRKHRNLRLKASSETGNHGNSIKSICKETDADTLKTGDIEYFQNDKTHCGAGDSEFFTATNEGRLNGWHAAHVGSDSEMACLDLRIPAQVGRRAMVHHLSLGQNVNPIGIFEDEGELLFDQ
jgi:hypothetical protein